MDAETQPNLAPAIPIYLRRLHADSTRRAYEREITRFLAWLESNAPLDDEILPRYVEHLRARDLSSTFIAWRATVIASFLRDCHRQGVLDRDLTEGYRLPRGTTGSAVRVLGAEELRRLLRVPDRRSWQGKRDLAVLTLLGIGGLRAGEVCSLRMADIEITPTRVVLKVTGKGNRVRVVAFESRNALPLRTWAKLRGAGDAGEPWFVARRVGGGVGPRGLNVAAIDYLTRKHGRAAGLARLHAHLLRHSCASLALAGGASIVAVRDLLGHSSVLTTSRYLHAGTSERATTSCVTSTL